MNRLFGIPAFLTLFAIACISCNPSSKETKILDGKWNVTSHRLVFFSGSNNDVVLDTMVSESGTFEFKRTNDGEGTYTFTPSEGNGAITNNFTLSAYEGTFKLTDLKTSVDLMLYSEGGGAVKNIKIIDFGRREQVWYADYSLNFESGACETMYVEKD